MKKSLLFSLAFWPGVLLLAEDPLASEQKIAEMMDVSANLPPKKGVAHMMPLYKSTQATPILSLENGGFASEPTFETHFEQGWEKKPVDWRIATWRQNKTQMSKERVDTTPEGELVMTVKAGSPPRGASIQSKREFGYGRWVARVRPSPVPGVLNSIFTNDWDDLNTADNDHDGLKAEVDIEFLSYSFEADRGEVHLAIHLKDQTPLWHVDIPLDFNPSAAYHEWGFDILPDRVVWHVDGNLLFAWKYTATEKVDPNYEFFFNAWTRKTWIQGPPAVDADYHIDWVKFYPLLP